MENNSNANKKRLPFGLRLMRVVFFLSGIFYLFALLINIYEGIYNEPENILYIIFNLIQCILIIVCISRPSYSLFKISVGSMVVNIIIIIFLSFKGYQIPQSSLTILYMLLNIWFFYKLKNYFISGLIDRDNPEIKRINKKFIILFIIIWLLTVYLSVSNFLINNVAQIINDKCRLDEKKDDCIINELVFYRTINRHFKIDPVICSYLSTGTDQESKIRLLSCYALIERCDLVTETKGCNDIDQLMRAKIDFNNSK